MYPHFRYELLAAFAHWTRRAVLVAVLTAIIAACSPPAAATTVAAPDFDSLVQQADYVVRGTVRAIDSAWVTDAGQRHIITKVQVDVAEVITGTPPQPLVLEMLGGRVGDDEMVVQGSPRFTVGGEYVLFIRGNGVQFNPLVALMHGQYPIKKDVAANTSYMARSDGTPLSDEHEVSLPLPAPASTASARSTAAEARPLTPEEFSRRIRTSRQKSADSSHEK